MRLHLPPHRATGSVDDEDHEPACPKFRAVRRWVARRLGGVRHERHVAAIASNLFDLTRPLHKLAPGHRRLLRLGALVHDVGRCISKPDHPKEGARLLLADDALPLTPPERRALAYLALHHRGPVPAAGRDAVLHRTDDHDRLLHVLALLRAADALDSRSLEPARMVFALVAAPSRTARRQLRATCYLASDCAKARRVYRRRKKFRLLEELLDVRVNVQIDHAEALRLVA
jgi:exopolyphosphatase/guanosine-5'-triphosphate,3'-diphosphate pyrophosphatase